MSRRHEYDQHFLSSPRVVAELVGHSNLRKNDLVYDFGAGSGVITSVLARRVRQVVAVENEPQALAKLRANVGQLDNVTIEVSDLLQTALPEAPYKVFSNIPFSHSARLVTRLTTSDQPPKSIYLIVQRQFARKLLFGGHFTAMLGVQIAPWWTVRIRRPLKRSDFTPPPNVDTVLLEIKQRTEPLLDESKRDTWRAFIERCFSEQKYFKTQARFEISGRFKKPSELDLEEWLALAEKI